jgi:hypothetical protein
MAQSRFVRNFLALFAALAGAAYAQPKEPDPYNFVARARQFLRAVYPGLNQPLYVTIWDHQLLSDPDVQSAFAIAINKPYNPGPGGVPAPRVGEVTHVPVEPNLCGEGCECKDPVLNGEFDFDTLSPDRELWRAWMGGPFLTCRLDKLLEEVHKHPDWTEARILEEVKSSGAKFGPDRKAELLRVLPVEKLKPFVGKIEVSSVEFDVSHLTWLVRLTWFSRDGRPDPDARCYFTLEPFDAKLITFSRHVPPFSGGKQNAK